jgi:hypothetical protein
MGIMSVSVYVRCECGSELGISYIDEKRDGQWIIIEKCSDCYKMGFDNGCIEARVGVGGDD